jgi:hypothetical protein
MNREKKIKYSAALKTLFDQYFWIRELRRNFAELFENENNVKIVNSVAGSFFEQIGVMMMHQLTLSYCKITDPVDKHERNLSLAYFVDIEMEDKDKADICDLYAKILGFRIYLVKARNKVVAHNDFETLTNYSTYGDFPEGEDYKFQRNVDDFFNILSRIINGTIFGEISLGSVGDVDDLIKYLKYGYAFEKYIDSLDKSQDMIDMYKYIDTIFDNKTST